MYTTHESKRINDKGDFARQKITLKLDSYSVTESQQDVSKSQKFKIQIFNLNYVFAATTVKGYRG